MDNLDECRAGYWALSDSRNLRSSHFAANWAAKEVIGNRMLPRFNKIGVKTAIAF